MPETVQASYIGYLAEHWEVGIWIALFGMTLDTLRRRTRISWAFLPWISGAASLLIFFIGCKLISPELWQRFVSFWTLGRY